MTGTDSIDWRNSKQVSPGPWIPEKAVDGSVLASTVPLHQWGPSKGSCCQGYLQWKGFEGASWRQPRVCLSLQTPWGCYKKHPFNRFAARLQLIKQVQVMKGWSCSADSSFAALRAWEPHPKHPCGMLAGPASLCPAAQHLSRSLGDAAQPWGCAACVAQTPAAAGGTDLAQAGSWPSAQAVPIWKDFYFIWMDFLCIWGDAALLPEPALTAGEACKRQLSPPQRHCTGSGNWINSDYTQQAFISLIFLLSLSSFLPR